MALNRPACSIHVFINFILCQCRKWPLYRLFHLRWFRTLSSLLSLSLHIILCSRKGKILDLLLAIAFNANLYYLTINFFLLFPNVDNCKNWQYLYYYVKWRVLVDLETYRITTVNEHV